MEKMREFKDLDEDGRKEAFDKFVRRQKVGCIVAHLSPLAN